MSQLKHSKHVNNSPRHNPLTNFACLFPQQFRQIFVAFCELFCGLDNNYESVLTIHLSPLWSPEVWCPPQLWGQQVLLLLLLLLTTVRHFTKTTTSLCSLLSDANFWCSQFIIIVIIFNIRLSQLSAPRLCLGHCVVKTRYRAHCSLPAGLAACSQRVSDPGLHLGFFSSAPALVPGPARLLARVSGRRCSLQPGWWDVRLSSERGQTPGHWTLTHYPLRAILSLQSAILEFITLRHYDHEATV